MKKSKKSTDKSSERPSMLKQENQADNTDKNKKEKLNKKQVFMVVLSSVFIGFLNGFFGGGGGMVCVPLLEKVLHIENKKAHATTICVIAALSAVSSVFYFSKNTFEFKMIAFTAGGVFLGGFLGAFLLNKLKGKYVRLIFAVLMLIAGIQMVI